MTSRVAGLFCYPVKSCKGISVYVAEIGRMGIRSDRQWMVVDAQTGMFVAQRQDKGLGIEVKTMCLVETAFRGDRLVLRAPEMPLLELPLIGLQGPTRSVQIWKTTCEGMDQGDEAAEWWSEFISIERPGRYRFVRMADDGLRRAKSGNSQLAYADGYPFLVISEGSLADLNGRMAEPLPMDRFRPNIVIAGCEPYAEDLMDRFQIGGVMFEGGPLCVRCPITQTDQQTAVRAKEPLRTLATYRRDPGGGVVFGRNFGHGGVGAIMVGDPIQFI